ncbi:lytic transglycosylase domain-containing protein [Lentibacter algarum]|uniref:lytic transglycosylase domain-containing protein n=1 Tax=Lentibacter algarum TaxID=576131 RepID=UPI001C09348B|nr:lytic transglycosylase domain-containing protein [Lentibacter algarum]MBU2982970.1 lytic transglycosylase domain-containing protein [Lentibacter algarum]
MRRLLKYSLVALISAVPAAADEPAPFRSFTFKSVKPPSSGSKKKRITIQITPEDLERQRGKSSTLGAPTAPKVAKPAESGAKPAKSAAHYAWFWDKVSPKIAESGPGRLRPALILLDNGPGGKNVTSPRLQVMQEIAAKHGADILRETIGTNVSPALVLAVIAIESGGRVDAVSKAGAQGLMQLMPPAAKRFGVEDRLKPSQNIKGGVAYLNVLMKQWGNDPILTLASYNAGENAVKKHGGVPDYAETRDYVPKVLAAFKTARGLCLTPPELASDGCVFNVKLAKAEK